MPELPEVEVLVRALRPLILNKTIRRVSVRRQRVIRPASAQSFSRRLLRARFTGLERRGKYLVFHLQSPTGRDPLILVAHLGMTGRMFLAPRREELPKHAAVILSLGQENFIFEDTRYFGRMGCDIAAVDKLGPEPLGPAFTPEYLHCRLNRSSQPVKVKLLDQALVAGVGNIYASEALFRAGISPKVAARKITLPLARHLVTAIRAVLLEAIAFGSTVPLNYSGRGKRNRLFYYGTSEASQERHEERLHVYDRAGRPCPKCGAEIRRFVQAGRSTFFCPGCQPEKTTRASRRPGKPRAQVFK